MIMDYLNAFIQCSRSDFTCAVILISVFLNSMRTLERDVEVILIRRFIIFSILYVVFYSVHLFFVDGYVSPDVLVSTICVMGYHISQTMVAYLWFLFSEYKQEHTFHGKTMQVVLFIPVAVYLVSLFVSLKADFYFHIDENAVYHRGPLFFVQYLVIAPYILYSSIKALILSFKKENYVNIAMYRALFTFVIPPAIGIIYQFFHHDVFYVGIGITCSVLITYLVLIQESVSSDPLTRINNRKQMFRFLSSKIKSGGGVFLIIIDANKFKYINDHFGHMEGDSALVKIAEAMRKVTEKTQCFISRFGGDEFIMLYETESEADVERLCDLLDKELKSINDNSGAKYDLTVSHGWTRVSEDEPSLVKIIERADQELYKNKKIAHSKV